MALQEALGFELGYAQDGVFEVRKWGVPSEYGVYMLLRLGEAWEKLAAQRGLSDTKVSMPRINAKSAMAYAATAWTVVFGDEKGVLDEVTTVDTVADFMEFLGI